MTVDATEVRRLQQAGVAVTWDIDDDIAAIPADAPALAPIGGKVGRERLVRQMQQVAALADGITTTTKHLADLYDAPQNAPVSIIDNSLPPWFLDCEAEPHDMLTIGWVAGAEHAIDAEFMNIASIVQRLLEAHRRLRFVGVGIDLQISHPRYDCRGFVSYEDLPTHIAEFDIGIAPLCGMPLNWARSTIKVKEYAALGIPWLASARPPFSGLGEQQGGRLVPDGNWYKEIEFMVKHGRLRRQLARNARAWALRESIDAYAPLWERAFLAALERAKLRGRGTPLLSR